MSSIRCPVLGARVVLVRETDFEGNLTRIICAEYEEAAGTCRLKESALSGGLLSQLLERMSEDSLGTRGTLCPLRQT